MRAGPWPESPWISPGRVAPAGCLGNLDPGEAVTWNLRFFVPADTLPGTYLTGTYSPVYEGKEWAAASKPITLDVQPRGATWPQPPRDAPPYAMAYVDQSQPKVLAPGAEGSVVVRVRNVGRAAWGPDVRLGSKGDKPIRYGGEGTIEGVRVRFRDEDGDGVVSYTEVATFEYKLVPPAGQAAAYRQYFQMVRDAPAPDGRWFGNADGSDPGIYVPTVIADATHFPPELGVADCPWQYAGQGSVGPGPLGGDGDPVVVSSGEAHRYFFRLKNTSELCPWPSGILHLAADRPKDRLSKFSANGTAFGWLSANRLQMQEAKVIAPGDTVEIPFDIKPNNDVPNGFYKEYFTPVMEDRFHMTDFGMYVAIRKE
jgi:hypothetical protein